MNVRKILLGAIFGLLTTIPVYALEGIPVEDTIPSMQAAADEAVHVEGAVQPRCQLRPRQASSVLVRRPSRGQRRRPRDPRPPARGARAGVGHADPRHRSRLTRMPRSPRPGWMRV